MKQTIKIHPSDNVIVALEDLSKGQVADGVTLVDDVKKGHKFACRDISQGSDVIKYGQIIGVATQDIVQGSHVHTHNMRTKLNGR